MVFSQKITNLNVHVVYNFEKTFILKFKNKKQRKWWSFANL